MPSQPEPPLHQHISLVTLAVADLERSRRFYEQGLGWTPALANDEVAFYQCGALVVSLYPGLPDDLGLAEPSRPGGIALAHNVPSRAEADALLAAAQAVGATIIKPAQATPWGGYVGYFADPDGHPWEVAHNPGFPLGADGSVTVPQES